VTFRQLEYLEAIALERSISRAAEKLFVSQSALSQQVIAMENEYQIQIFDRAKTPLELTADGQLYLHTAQELLRVKRQFEATVRHRRQHSLCIKTVPFYAANVVPYLLSKLHRELPQVEVQLKMDWAPNLFCTSYHEKVDLYVHAFDMDPYEPLIPPSDTMEQEVILEEEIVLALSALHPLLAGLSIGTDGEGWPSIDLADLAGAAFILPSTSVRLLDIAHLLCSGVAGEHTVRVSDKGFDALLGLFPHPGQSDAPAGSGGLPQGHRAEHPRPAVHPHCPPGNGRPPGTAPHRLKGAMLFFNKKGSVLPEIDR